jgi:hypothetical protein
VDDGLIGRSLVIGNGVREKRDERRWHGLHPLLGAGVWLIDCIGVMLSLVEGGSETLYLSPDMILL